MSFDIFFAWPLALVDDDLIGIKSAAKLAYGMPPEISPPGLASSGLFAAKISGLPTLPTTAPIPPLLLSGDILFRFSRPKSSSFSKLGPLFSTISPKLMQFKFKLTS